MVSCPGLRALATIALLATTSLGGCSFDRARLEALECTTSETCPSGTYCSRDGYCLTTLRDAGPRDADVPDDVFCASGDNDGDEVPDCEDNCPALANPPQLDSDGDGAGNECDCLPLEEAFAKFIAKDEFELGAGGLTGVSGTWGASSSWYRQTTEDGEALSWVPGATSNVHYVSSNLRVNQGGIAALGRRAAGLMIRASSLTASDGTAYLCGVHLEPTRRLFLAHVDFAGGGTLTELNSAPLAPTFSVVPGPDSWISFHPLTAIAEGDSLTCRLTNAMLLSEAVEVTATDPALTAGSAGFFTLGSRADFGFITACGDPP